MSLPREMAGKSEDPVSSSKKNRGTVFQELLSQEEIDLEKLRTLCFVSGCPERLGLRATCWKLFLGYLPFKKRCWDEELQWRRNIMLTNKGYTAGKAFVRFASRHAIQKKIKSIQVRQGYTSFLHLMVSWLRASYQQLVDDIIVNPYAGESGRDRSSSLDMIDHPLNPNPDSQWLKYFKDNDILVQIDHDTRRLYPEISFFHLATQYPRTDYNAGTVLGIEALKERVDRSSLPSQQVATSRFGVRNMSTSKKEEPLPFSSLKKGEEAHWEVVERILFVHTKMNKGIGYVQGMNELIGPIYYVFAQHPEPEWREHAEADTFFCFAILMAEVGHHFTKKLDHSRAGIGGSMFRLMDLLKRKDPCLHKSLEEKRIDPTFYGFRWITLLLSQEFLLPEVLRIWDSLFADSCRFDFLIYLCCSMLLCVRTELIEGDFAICVKLLQHYPLCDIQKLLLTARDIQKYYSLPRQCL